MDQINNGSNLIMGKLLQEYQAGQQNPKCDDNNML